MAEVVGDRTLCRRSKLRDLGPEVLGVVEKGQEVFLLRPCCSFPGAESAKLATTIRRR